MAEIVQGFGVAHSTQLNMPVEYWLEMGEGDKRSTRLVGADGAYHPYAELAAHVSPDVAKALTPAEMNARHARCQADIARINQLVRDAAVDVLITVTDDERWLFTEGMFPTVYMHWGETIPYVPRIPENPTPMAASSLWAYSMEPVDFKGAPQLGEHVLTELSDRGFDITQGSGTPPGGSIGRPYGFVAARVLGGNPNPPAILPVIINASYRPNLITTRRAVELGEAIAAAVNTWGSDAKVGVLAVGNLSHPVLDEAMDQRLLQALGKKDMATLRGLSQSYFSEGNGQFKTWMVAAAALNHLDMELLDYVACYRSEGGTGCAMPFARWK